MLKANTVLTALAVVLLGLLSFMGAHMWNELVEIRGNTITSNAQIKDIYKIVDDHETRIRSNEHDITVLQGQLQPKVPPSYRSPKQQDNQ